MYLRHMLLCLTALTGVAEVPCAMAQSQPNSSQTYQTVRLPDGSIYQGELVELVPGDHLTIRLATGEIKRFAWNEILQSGTPAAAAVPGWLGGLISASSLTPPLVPPAPEDLVQLHYQASDPEAVLFSTRTTNGVRFNNPGLNYDFQDWTMLCPRAPCDVRADRRQIYSIQGPSIVRSLPFTLPQANSVTAYARVAHQGTRTFFSLATALGGAAMVTGLVLVIFGAAQDTTAFGTSPMDLQMQQDGLNNQRTFYTAGGALLGGGALLTITGIIASIYTRTSVHVDSDGHLALRLPGKAQLALAPMQVRF